MSLTVIILTYNEEKHIERSILSVKPFADNIFVIDSFSTDKTVDIASKNGAQVFQNPWVDHATQVNWAIKNCNIITDWIMRLDADEIVTPDLANEINHKLKSLSQDITGINLKRRVYFMGNWVRYGGYYPTWLLRIWRNGHGICEQRIMDEHIKLLQGKCINFRYDFIDENLNGLSWWTEKHNGYATKEAFELLNHIYNLQQHDELVTPRIYGSQAERKRWLKYRYAKMPLFVRPFIYFLYRYIFRLGFLDGRKGLIWHFLQGFWYRFLVDAKIYDIYRRAGKQKENIIACLKDDYGMKI